MEWRLLVKEGIPWIAKLRTDLFLFFFFFVFYCIYHQTSHSRIPKHPPFLACHHRLLYMFTFFFMPPASLLCFHLLLDCLCLLLYAVTFRCNIPYFLVKLYIFFYDPTFSSTSPPSFIVLYFLLYDPTYSWIYPVSLEWLFILGYASTRHLNVTTIPQRLCRPFRAGCKYFAFNIWCFVVSSFILFV